MRYCKDTRWEKIKSPKNGRVKHNGSKIWIIITKDNRCKRYMIVAKDRLSRQDLSIDGLFRHMRRVLHPRDRVAFNEEKNTLTLRYDNRWFCGTHLPRLVPTGVPSMTAFSTIPSPRSPGAAANASKQLNTTCAVE